MTDPRPSTNGGPQSGGGTPTESMLWPYIGVGCLTMFAGFFGGGMIAALVAKIVGGLRQCQPQNELPACNLWSFVGPGALIGAVLLPIVAISRMRGGRRDPAERT